MTESFKAFVIEDADGKPKGGFKQLSLADLPDNDVLVEVAYSTVNYKDGLAISGKGRIARKLPMVAGIDLAGTVVESRSPVEPRRQGGRQRLGHVGDGVGGYAIPAPQAGMADPPARRLQP